MAGHTSEFVFEDQNRGYSQEDVSVFYFCTFIISATQTKIISKLLSALREFVTRGPVLSLLAMEDRNVGILRK